MKLGFGLDEGKKISDLGAPGDEYKWLEAAEFQSLGFLQEVNRRILHRCGLALAVLVDEDHPEGWFGVLDYRADGIKFERLDEHADWERFEAVQKATTRDEQPMGDNQVGKTE